MFNSDSIWATINRYWPDRLMAIDHYERIFNKTIDRKGRRVSQRAEAAKSMTIEDKEALIQATEREYRMPIFLEPGEQWKLPPGAFSHSICGAR